MYNECIGVCEIRRHRRATDHVLRAVACMQLACDSVLVVYMP